MDLMTWYPYNWSSRMEDYHRRRLKTYGHHLLYDIHTINMIKEIILIIE